MTWAWEGLKEFDNAMIDWANRSNAQARNAVGEAAHLVEGFAKASFGPAHAKGTPKTVFDRPQSITGDLRRSIQVMSIRSIGFGSWESRVAPQTPYGRRIELGFMDMTDSLGRRFHQPAYPYMGVEGIRGGIPKALPVMPTVFFNAWSSALPS